MYSLVKFDNEEQLVVHSKTVRIVQGARCSIKYRGCSYSGYLIDTNDSSDALQTTITNSKSNERENESTALDVNSSMGESGNDPNNQTQQIPEDFSLSRRLRSSLHLSKSCENSSVLDGIYCSTPKSDDSSSLRDTIGLSAIETNTSNAEQSSAAPSGASEIVNFVGNSWMECSYALADNQDENPTVETPVNAQLMAHTDVEVDTTMDEENGVNVEMFVHHENGTSIVEETVLDMEYPAPFAGIKIIHDDQRDVTGESSQSDREHIIDDDSTYKPSIVSTVEESVLRHDDSFDRQQRKKKIVSIISQGPPIDDRQLLVPVSKDNNQATSKKHFCQFCKKLQTKYTRHVTTVHPDIQEVQECLSYPKGQLQKKAFTFLRNQGNYMHNTYADLTTNTLITCRRPQQRFGRTAVDFIACKNCLGYYSRNSLRVHYRKCNSAAKKGERGQLRDGNRLMGYCHSKANRVMQRKIIPSLNHGKVKRTIIYDKLIILYGNKLTVHYNFPHLYAMIRARLRLLARFLIAVKEFDRRITDFASVFTPIYYESVLEAVRLCGNYDAETMRFKNPANATALGTFLKRCGLIIRSVYIREQNEKRRVEVIAFLELMEEDFATSINKIAQEDTATIRRNKKIILPSKDDISKLYAFAKKTCEEAMRVLEKKFNHEAWKNINEGTLILLIMFNRRRPGESERFLLSDYQNRQNIDEALNLDIYGRVTEEARQQANQFVRVVCRGKKSRPVAALMHKFLLHYIDKILEYRSRAGVSETNPYLFAVPGDDETQQQYLRACVLMASYSKKCGANLPQTLRCTTLRKHIATYTAMLGLQDSQVTDLANFMGHHENIHKGTYRVPDTLKDMVEVSKLLQAALGQKLSPQNEKSHQEVSEERIEHNFTKEIDEPQPSSSKEYSGPRPLMSDSDDENDENVATNNINIKDRRVSAKRSYRKIDSSDESNSSDHEFRRPACKRAKAAPKKRMKWTYESRRILEKVFGDLRKIAKLPPPSKCNELIEKYSEFEGRTPQQMIAFIDNVRKSDSRREQRIRQKNLANE